MAAVHASMAAMEAVKLVIAGDSAVGKTALVISYTADAFQEDYIPGADDAYSKNYYVPWKVDGATLALMLWDTAACDTHPMGAVRVQYGRQAQRLRTLSYPNTDVFAIAFSVVSPASYENVAHWYKELQDYHSRISCRTTSIPHQKIDISKIPIVLVGTKADLRTHLGTLAGLAKKNQTPVTREQGEELAHKIGAVKYVECSAKT